ncbi:hypothetical protein [Thalassotalea piscium]|uniref:Uncharacterized protein n=1 Tax=Thalassotalea piscium TaxID=1230533 RepID=A0A7X0NJQ9_9GAMM|nr:hypothetical protein [Thalassotalea piscium]MBB6544713.1 hypothetical protein [Thalassotalea piscium]
MEKIIALADVILVAQQLSDSLRLGFLARSHHLTSEFIELLELYLAQNALENAQLTHILNVMLDTQQRDDRLYYADILQYELIPFLTDI